MIYSTSFKMLKTDNVKYVMYTWIRWLLHTAHGFSFIVEYVIYDFSAETRYNRSHHLFK